MAKSDQIASLFASVGFKVDRRSMDSLNKSLTNIENRVSRIRTALNGTKAGKNYGAAFKGLERQATGAATAIDNITKRYKNGLGALQGYTTATQALVAAMTQLRAVTPARLPRIPSQGGGRAGGGGVGRGRQGAAGGFVSGLFGGGASTFARGILPGLGAGWAALHTVQSGRKSIATENALAALTGSAGGGRAEYQYVKDFSNKYGLKASETADGYKRILASSVGSTLEGKGARNVFEGVSLYGKTLGLGNEEMSRASTAISQMISKGKISSEELKGQLAESLPGAVQIFASAMEVPVAQMFKMMENGEVLADEVLPKVANLLKQQAAAGGALEKSMKSSLSAQNRFLNKWEDFLKRVFEGGLDDSLATFFDMLSSSLKFIEPLLINITRAVNFLFVPLKGLIELFKILPGPLQAGVVGLTAFVVALFQWEKIMKGMTWLKSHPMIVFLTMLFLILEDFYVWTQGGKSLFGDLFGEFDKIMTPERWDGLFKAFDTFIAKIKMIRDGIREIKEMISFGEAHKGSNPNTAAARARGNAAQEALARASNPNFGNDLLIERLKAAGIGGGNTININVSGAGDPDAVADKVSRKLAAGLRIANPVETGGR